MSIGIYKIINPKGKIYIGQSINIERRFNEYQRLNCKNQTKLFNSLKKYGPENHKFEIIDKCLEEQLLERETYWKRYYKVLEIPSLCCRLDGRGGFLSIETRKKISENLTGRKHKEISKQKISQNHSSSKKIYQYNLKGELMNVWDSYSEAQRENKGNIKNNILGKTKHSNGFIWLREEDLDLLEERINKNINFTHPNKNKKPSEETLKLMSKNIKGKKTSFKKEYLLKNINYIVEDYKTLSSNNISLKYNVSLPTLISFLKENNIFKFRNHYNKLKYNGSI